MNWMKAPEVVSNKWCQCLGASCKGRCLDKFFCAFKWGSTDGICMVNFGG